MNKYKFDKNKYLNRINLTKNIENDIESLEAIQHGQLMSIPFENFDICLNKEISLEPGNIINKLIKNERGGYCFELNALMLMALKSFGFSARPLLGRVHLSGTPTGRGHQISLVEIEGEQWLVDVGFGAETPSKPIQLNFNHPIECNGQVYRLIDDELFIYMLQRKSTEGWKDLYSFDLNYICSGDIEYGNHFTATSPSSRFVTSRVAALPIQNGVVTLLNHTLKRRQDGKVTVVELEENESYISALESHFGIKLNASYSDLRPISSFSD
ncbi:MAG: N-hydroxyarylamine O-acetyltransferase [SAR86 cluster bacterium]|uniref:N-hydroxyarylamine O-acetyltransferase n=1 Tax=SAR86 cluster bacterium TaxID=2030880 RepID=A0A2A5CGE4_9GAMM|nr:MAG: N-hydroxyarylamine O-acetyltransferase [SAR86 cluster bacterium]